MPASNVRYKSDDANETAFLAGYVLGEIGLDETLVEEQVQWEPTESTYFGEAETLSRKWTVINGFRDAVKPTRKRRPTYFYGRPLDLTQKLVRELGRLQNGWAGDDSIAPSPSVLRDIQQVVASLPQATRAPDVEVDPDDGVVILRWLAVDVSRTFSLTFVGNKHVTGFYSADNGSVPAWKLAANDSVRLAIKFCADEIQSLLV